MLAVTIVLAALVGAFVFGLGGLGENAPEAAITAEFGSEHPNQINFTHMGGDPLDVHDLTIKIFVDGEPLEHQPDVPATGMEGFDGTPSGPFNSGSTDNIWTAGETASFIIATTTNSPQPTPGSRVVVKIYADDEVITVAEV